MALTKRFGKISSVRFGIGGYQESMLGLHVCFEFDSSGICTTKSYWDSNMIECSKHAKWSEEDRLKKYAEIMYYIYDLLKDAKLMSISDLKNIPVEVTLDDMTLYDWRILKEVL